MSLTDSDPARPARLVTRHRVRESIERMILEGARRPGERLVQDQLARQLGVSRGVVREALMELQAGGLVETADNKGAMVAPIDPDRLAEAFEIREVMEGLTARRCCERMTFAQHRELRELTGRMDEQFRAGNWQEGGRLDRQFHLRLIELARSRLLEQFAGGCLVVSKFVTVPGGDSAEPGREHLRLLEAIASGDAGEAERVAREHVRANRDHVN